MIRALPPLSLGILGVSASLVLLLPVQFLLMDVSPAPARVASPRMQIEELPLYAPPGIERFSALQSRPPFSPLRRLAQAGEEIREKGATPAPQLKFLGVISDKGASIAVVRDTTSQEVLNLKAGAAIGGWEVGDVRDERLLLRRGDKTQEIWLDGSPRRERAGGEGLSHVNFDRSPDD